MNDILQNEPVASEFLLCQTEDGQTRLEVRLQEDTVWLTQKRMAELFQKSVRTINEHIQNIFEEGELSPESVIRNFRITAEDGKQYNTQHNNLQRAHARIIPRVKHHARELGVVCSKIKIVDSLYRWGSCTVNNNVNFNWRLIKAPMWVIDYVVIHELAHLIEANHTGRFWNIINSRTVHAEKARQWLKAHGQLLEQAL